MTHRYIPLAQIEARVETGVLQIGAQDWPGVFIRGDDALCFAMAIRRKLQLVSPHDDFATASALTRLHDLLSGCNAQTPLNRRRHEH